MKKLLALALLLTSLNLYADQKVVLITGSTGGLGNATVRSFQARGWKVWASYRGYLSEDLLPLRDVSFVRLDVRDAKMIDNAIARIMKVNGRIDALVNNAGYGIIGSEEHTNIEEAQKMFDVNFFGALRVTQAVIPIMREQRSGHIINISSTSGIRALPGLGVYAASKFALEGMSESLAVTLSPWNIKVALVEPGSVKNNWAKHCLFQEKDSSDPIYSKLTKNLFDKLVFVSKTAQECSEVASMIVDVAETAEPNMRYQTSEKVTSVVNKKFSDLTGNTMRDDQQAFFDLLTH